MIEELRLLVDEFVLFKVAVEALLSAEPSRFKLQFEARWTLHSGVIGAVGR